MSNNSSKESWERDTLKMKPVRPDTTDNEIRQAPGAAGPQVRPSSRSAQYDETDTSGKGKIVIGIIAAIIVVLSLVLMYLDMSEKNGTTGELGDDSSYEDAIEYDEKPTEDEMTDFVDEEETTTEEEKTEEEEETVQEETKEDIETESTEKEDKSESLPSEEASDSDTPTPESESEPTPAPEGLETPAAEVPSAETPADQTSPAEIQ